jgi:hypothetical protein
MSKFNLDDDNVEVVELSLQKARSDDLDLAELLVGPVDEAQAKVFGGDHTVSYVVIRITP